MKRFIIAALLVLTVTVTPSAGPPKSVQALQTGAGQNFCTAFSINEKQHYFVTAAHCVLEDEEGAPPKPYILGQPVDIVAADKEADIAVVRAAFGAPALKVATKQATYKDYIEIEGFPYGMPGLITFRGELVYPYLEIPQQGTYAIFDCTAAPGNSGSPVLDKDHKIISILQVGWQAGRITGGAPQRVLQRVLEPYTE